MACTTDDVCLKGVCTGVLATCLDNNPCTVDRCVEGVTNETNKRQTTYNLTNKPIDLIISKTAMLFITNFKSTNEVKQASKAVGSTAVETMVTEDAVGCVFESKDFGGIQIICDYGFNDVVQKAIRKVFTSTGVKSIPKEQIHVVKQLLIRKGQKTHSCPVS